MAIEEECISDMCGAAAHQKLSKLTQERALAGWHMLVSFAEELAPMPSAQQAHLAAAVKPLFPNICSRAAASFGGCNLSLVPHCSCARASQCL